MNVFQKLGLISMAGIHALLDITIKGMSPAILKENIRRFKAAIEKIKDEVVLKQDDVNKLDREIHADLARITKLNGDILVLRPNNGAAPAADVMSKMQSLNATAMQIEKGLPGKRERLESWKSAFAEMNRTVGLLEVKLAEMETALNQVESDQHIIKAQDAATQAIETGLAAAGGSNGVDNMVEQSRRDKLVSDARLKRTTDKVSAEVGGSAFAAEADARLAGLLGGNSQPGK